MEKMRQMPKRGFLYRVSHERRVLCCVRGMTAVLGRRTPLLERVVWRGHVEQGQQGCRDGLGGGHLEGSGGVTIKF